jgi:hypothetical protein
MIGSIHIQVSPSGGDATLVDTKAVQHSVEQVLLSTIQGLSEVAVQVEKEGMGGFQSCFCNGSRLKSGIMKDNMPWST